MLRLQITFEDGVKDVQSTKIIRKTGDNHDRCQYSTTPHSWARSSRLLSILPILLLLPVQFSHAPNGSKRKLQKDRRIYMNQNPYPNNQYKTQSKEWPNCSFQEETFTRLIIMLRNPRSEEHKQNNRTQKTQSRKPCRSSSRTLRSNQSTFVSSSFWPRSKSSNRGFLKCKTRLLNPS